MMVYTFTRVFPLSEEQMSAENVFIDFVHSGNENSCWWTSYDIHLILWQLKIWRHKWYSSERTTSPANIYTKLKHDLVNLEKKLPDRSVSWTAFRNLCGWLPQCEVNKRQRLNSGLWTISPNKQTNHSFLHCSEPWVSLETYDFLLPNTQTCYEISACLFDIPTIRSCKQHRDKDW